jgi:hypothetical protein
VYLTSMPFTTSYDPALRILFVRVEGALSPEMFDAALASITSAADYPANVDTIYDFRAADFSGTHSIDMQRMRGVRTRYAGREGAILALVVADDVGFGMSRMFQLLFEGDASPHLTVTRSLDEARRWILERRGPARP